MSGPEGERRIIRYLIFVPLSVLLIVLVIFYLENLSQRSDEQATRLVVGQLAPDFTLPDMEGHEVSLSSYRGKVVLLNIWATWCPTCLEEMPQLQQLYEEFAKYDNFQLLTISIDALGRQVVEPFMEKNGLTLPTLLDPRGSIKKIYHTTGVPESFIIDQRGVLIDKIIGPRDWTSDPMKRYLLALLKRDRELVP